MNIINSIVGLLLAFSTIGSVIGGNTKYGSKSTLGNCFTLLIRKKAKNKKKRTERM